MHMIEGLEIIIKQLELGDEQFLHAWGNDSGIMEYSGLKYGFLWSKEAFRREIMKDIENTEIFPEEKTFIIYKKKGLEPIGHISYRNWDKRNRSAEIGIEIAKLSERGRGYGQDALYHFLDFMFRFLNLNRIMLKTRVDNIAAQRLYKKLSFKNVGIMRDAWFDSRDCKYVNFLYMDLLLRDWIKRTEQPMFNKSDVS